MALNLADNYFELFGLRPMFRIETAALEDKYRELQRALHPDRYAAAGQHERQLAVRAAAHVNDAYRALQDDCARAQYLLKLSGVATDDEQNTTQDAEFLMRQMELREAVEDSQTADDSAAALASLADTAADGKREALAEFDQMWQSGEMEAARDAMNKARFFQKIAQEIKMRIHQCARDARAHGADSN